MARGWICLLVKRRVASGGSLQRKKRHGHGMKRRLWGFDLVDDIKKHCTEKETGGRHGMQGWRESKAQRIMAGVVI